ncbi:MAG: hypothetical protein N2036_14655 [Bryobacteraceae bacterium]|nr:hypothetical protein [Bryobacteraceae bacterium]
MKLALAMLAGLLTYGQAWEGNEAVIQARIRGGGSPDQGKCTAEVEVDGVAEVALHGSEGRIRTISGQPATWRRLDCTGPLPSNFADFRFRGVDGRGRQTLLNDPRTNRGIAVVRIEDPQGGREGYTFDVEWRAGADWNTGGRSGNWRRGREGPDWESSTSTLRAAIRGGGGDRGKCTAEVEVDGVAEVGIRGDTGEIRTVSGQPATWRRLECTGPLPANPSDFRFRGIDGRGRQELVGDPRTNRGLAIVRIEDPQGGREGYTFDLEWRGGSAWPAGSGSGWGTGSGGWGTAPGSGWGSGSGTGWGGGGWGSGWGDTFSYRGSGSGMFSPEAGAGYDLRGVFLTMDRRSGDVQMRFDSRLGADVLQLRGRIERISGDVVEARLYEGVNRGDAAQVDARARIQMRDANRVRAIQIDGMARGQRFRVQYAE